MVRKQRYIVFRSMQIHQIQSVAALDVSVVRSVFLRRFVLFSVTCYELTVSFNFAKRKVLYSTESNIF